MKTIHSSDQNHAILERIRKEKKKKKLDDILTLLIGEHEILKNQPKIDVSIQKEDDSIKCINRIFFRGFPWCVNRPPKMIRLETLDICKVCKQRRLGLTESSKVETAQDFKENQPVLYRGKTPLKAGTVYCSFSGMYVFSAKCDSCKQWSCEVKKKKREQEVQP
jgi:hypothetical protein